MRVETESSAPRARTATTAGLARLRRGSLAVLVLLVVEYAIGMYVNLYVTMPGADHGGSLGSAISNGPASLSVHAVIGLLLGLGVAAQSILVRLPKRDLGIRRPLPRCPILGANWERILAGACRQTRHL